VKLRLYVRREVIVWLALTSAGTVMSVLSGHEMRAGIESIRRVALQRPHAEDVLRMARHNLVAEYCRTVAQVLFLMIGLFSLVSPPPITYGRSRVFDRISPWVIVLVEAILVGNSVNEYLLSKRVLKRRAKIHRSAGSA
jgi:hypothetical protein